MVSAASRSGIPTTTLKDAYFTFIGDTVMVTNLLREPKTFRYDYDGNTISQSGEMDVNYEIVKLSTDTLVMKANIQNYDFEFFLLKDKDFELDRIEQPVPR